MTKPCYKGSQIIMDKEEKPEVDQPNGSEGTESDAKVEDNQGDQDNKESNEGNQDGEQELYDLPDGRKVDGKTLSKEWKENFYPDYTRKSQKLSEFEKAQEAKRGDADTEARDQIDKNEYLKNVAPDVKAAIAAIVSPLIKASFDEREQKSTQAKQDEAFESDLKRLEGQFKGGNGLPKFDRNRVLNAMKDPSNKIFDPEIKFRQMYDKEFSDNMIKEALKKQRGGNDTEDTGTSDGERKPDGKTPKTWAEAATRAASRF